MSTTWFALDNRCHTGSRDVNAGVALARCPRISASMFGFDADEKDRVVAELAGGPIDAPDLLAAGAWESVDVGCGDRGFFQQVLLREAPVQPRRQGRALWGSGVATHGCLVGLIGGAGELELGFIAAQATT